MEDLERIVDLDNEIIARLMESILFERGIPHILRTYQDSAYDGLWAYTQGWGCIEASPEYREQIIQIYNDIKKQEEE